MLNVQHETDTEANNAKALQCLTTSSIKPPVSVTALSVITFHCSWHQTLLQYEDTRLKHL